MKLIQTFSNENLSLNKVARVYVTEPQPGFEAIHKASYEVSTHSGGVDVAWNFYSFAMLEDAQAYAIQFIMPKVMLCKIVN